MAAEGPTCLRGPACFHRVNGAATGWPRKVVVLTRVVGGLERQWGRDRMAAEGGGGAPVRWQGRASMGPRPDGRGRSYLHSPALSASQASMGPRPDGRGRVRGGAVWVASCFVRQWGRDRMAAEGAWYAGAPAAAASVNGAATGWPRKAGRRGATRGSVPRVNGAATGWPRKAGAAEPAALWGRRQWGRDRMAAEGHVSHPPPIATGRVNGAATGWPRKAGSAASSSAWIAGVNGAATGWPRKAIISCLTSVGTPWRQWGRDRMAAEGLSLAAARTPAMSVNGAATGWPRKGNHLYHGVAVA